LVAGSGVRVAFQTVASPTEHALATTGLDAADPAGDQADDAADRADLDLDTSGPAPARISRTSLNGARR
jgi:hypothetical protein